MIIEKVMRPFLPLLLVALLFSCKTAIKEQPATVLQQDTVVKDTVNKTVNISTVNITDSVVPAAQLIVPGKSIGLTMIGEKGDILVKNLGPANDGDAAMGKSIGTWYSKSNKAHTTTVYMTTNFGDKEEAKRVSQVRITSPYFSTAAHIAVGSSFEKIKTAFPSLKKSGTYPEKTSGKTIMVYDDVAGGMAVEISPAGECIGITIHKPGEKAFETYLVFLPGYTPIQ